MRAHGERICRTLVSTDVPERPAAPADQGSANPADEFLKDLEDELVEALFGSRGKGKEKDESDKDVSRPVPGLGALAADDCVVGEPITRQQWNELVTRSHNEATQMKTGAARNVLDGTAWEGFRPATHVAIDRWTGAAADSLLFSRIEPSVDDRSKPRELALWLDLDRIAPPPGADDLADFSKVAFALLIIILRDLADRRIPIGFGATRGLGSIRVEEIAFAGLGESLLGTGSSAEVALTPEDFRKQEAMERFRDINAAWQRYWARRTSGHGAQANG